MACVKRYTDLTWYVVCVCMHVSECIYTVITNVYCTLCTMLCIHYIYHILTHIHLYIGARGAVRGPVPESIISRGQRRAERMGGCRAYHVRIYTSYIHHALCLYT